MFDKTIFIKNNKKAEAFRTTSFFSAKCKYTIYNHFHGLSISLSSNWRSAEYIDCHFSSLWYDSVVTQTHNLLLVASALPLHYQSVNRMHPWPQGIFFSPFENSDGRAQKVFLKFGLDPYRVVLLSSRLLNAAGTYWIPFSWD